MTLSDSENELFYEWHKHIGLDKDFYKDGAMPYFKHEPKKILFILKEGNNGGNDPEWWKGADMRDFAWKGDRIPTWANIARWTRLILEHDLNDDDDDRSRIRRYAPRVAAMNLKKEPGGATSDMRAIAAAARRDRDFIKRQVALYEPIDLTVCCGSGTYCSVAEIFNLSVEKTCIWGLQTESKTEAG